MSNSPTALLCSLKFAPGLKKELATLGTVFDERGFTPRYLVSSAYQHIDAGKEFEQACYVTESKNLTGTIAESINPSRLHRLWTEIRKHRPEFLLLYNPHPLNLVLARFARYELGEDIQIGLYLHEPYKPDKSTYSLDDRAKFILLERLQSALIPLLDHVILPSELAEQRFSARYGGTAVETHFAPILLPDAVSQPDDLATDRRYFSKIGMVNAATGHGDFMNMIERSIERDGTFQFSVISSSDVSEVVGDLSRRARNVLNVVSDEFISDQRIYQEMRRSYGVFKLDKELTQSGVVPVAFMHGTPVIAYDIPGLSQHVTHKETGYLVPVDCSSDTLLDAMWYVRDEFERLSDNARAEFESVWHLDNWRSYYDWLQPSATGADLARSRSQKTTRSNDRHANGQ